MPQSKVMVPQNAVGTGGFTGFSNVINTGDEVPSDYRPSLTFIDARGRRRDSYGNLVEEEGYAQEAIRSGSEEQKNSTSFNALEDAPRKGTGEAGDITETNDEGDEK